MQNFEEQVKKIMEESAKDIQEQVKDQIKKQIIDSLTWSLRDEVSKIVKETILSDMKDDIKAIVIESKPLVIAELQGSIVKIVAAIGNGLVETASKNMAQSWNVTKVIEAVLK